MDEWIDESIEQLSPTELMATTGGDDDTYTVFLVPKELDGCYETDGRCLGYCMGYYPSLN